MKHCNSFAVTILAVATIALSGCNQAPPKQHGIYAFDHGRYTPLGKEMPEAKRHDFSSSVRILISAPQSDLAKLPPVSIRKRALLRFVIGGKYEWVVLAEPFANPTPGFAPFVATGESIPVQRKPVANRQDLQFLVPEITLTPGLYAVEASSEDVMPFAVGVDEAHELAAYGNNCVDKTQDGNLQPCDRWDSEFKAAYFSALKTQDNGVSQVLAPSLVMVALVGDFQLLKEVIERGAIVDTIYPDTGISLLDAATCSCDQRAVDLLISHGATLDPQHRVGKGELLLSVASSCRMMKLVTELIKRGADVNADNGEPLFSALGNDRKPLNRNVFEARMNYIADGNDPLPIVRLLLDKGADPNAVVRDTSVRFIMRGGPGATPLYAATVLGEADVVSLLIERHANVNAKLDNGYTPLHAAASFGYLKIVQILVEHGADLNALQNTGATPLALAKLNGQTKVAEFLAAHGGR